MPIAPPRPSVVATIDDILDRMRAVETELAMELPGQWVAEHGPRFETLKKTMVFVHQAHHAVEAAVKSLDRNGVAYVEDAMVQMAAVAIKGILDIRSATGACYREHLDHEIQANQSKPARKRSREDDDDTEDGDGDDE